MESSRPRIELIFREDYGSSEGKPFLVPKADLHIQLCLTGGRNLSIPDCLAASFESLLIDIEADVHSIEFDQSGQQGCIGGNDIAGVHASHTESAWILRGDSSPFE